MNYFDYLAFGFVHYDVFKESTVYIKTLPIAHT